MGHNILREFLVSREEHPPLAFASVCRSTFTDLPLGKNKTEEREEGIIWVNNSLQAPDKYKLN